MQAVDEQTIGFQFTVSEGFDGSTQAELPTLATAKANDEQFFEQSAAELGLFPLNWPAASERPFAARGNRWVLWIQLKLQSAAPAGSVIELVDTSSVDGETTVLKEIENVSTRQFIYRDLGFLAPQGSQLRVNAPVGGVLRYGLVFLTNQALAMVSSIASADTEAASTTSDGLVFSGDIYTAGAPRELSVGVIQRYDASALMANDMSLLLPPSPVKDQVTGAKECGNSAVPITVDGNGIDVELPGSAPVASGSVGLARIGMRWQYDGTVWRLF